MPVKMRTFKKAAKDSDLQRLEDLLIKLEAQYGREFMSSVASIKAKLDLDAVEEMVATGRYSDFLANLEKQYALFANAVVAGMFVAGESTAAFISGLTDSLVAFDATNPIVIDAARSNRLRLITGLDDSQRQAISEVIIDGVTRGINPRQQALAIREVIGLTPNQARAVQKYRALLEDGSTQALSRKLRDKRFDSTVRRAAKDKAMLSSTQIDRMVERYSERMLRYRSEVIARTEALRSVNQGNNIVFQQAVGDGVLLEHEIQRTWNTASDERVRSSHRAMHGQIVGLNENFISGNGNALSFPGDINAPGSETIQCRCMATTRLL